MDQNSFYSLIEAPYPGPAEVLQRTKKLRRAPLKGEVCIRMEAVPVCGPDVSMRSGTGLWSGTVLGQKFPCVPGYGMIGRVEAVGPEVKNVTVGSRVAVLTVTGSYAELLYWPSRRLIPVPENVNAVEAAPVVLNAIVAYQALHRSARVQAGKKALIIGGSGGVGTAMIQLGLLAGLEITALTSKTDKVADLGVGAVNYRNSTWKDQVRTAAPDGYDYIFAGTINEEYLNTAKELLKSRDGVFVGYAEPPSRKFLWQMLGRFLKWNCKPRSARFKLYGTSSYFLFDKKPFLEDWEILFGLLADKKYVPIVDKVFPLGQAKEAHKLLETGTVFSNLVMIPDTLESES